MKVEVCQLADRETCRNAFVGMRGRQQPTFHPDGILANHNCAPMPRTWDSLLSLSGRPWNNTALCWFDRHLSDQFRGRNDASGEIRARPVGLLLTVMLVAYFKVGTYKMLANLLC
jgi:hypothetical protein